MRNKSSGGVGEFDSAKFLCKSKEEAKLEDRISA